MRPYSLLAALALPLLLTACGEPADDRPGQPVAHRRAAFQQILKAFEPMGIMLREKRYNADDFLQGAEKLHQIKDGPWSYFLPDTHYPPTKATAKVWDEPEKFAAARQKFLTAEGQLLEAARSKDEAKVRPAYEALHDTCRGCHQDFKK